MKQPRPKLDDDFSAGTNWLAHDSALGQVKGYGHNQLQPDTTNYPYRKQEAHDHLHKNLSASNDFYLKVDGRPDCNDPAQPRQESPKRRKDHNFSDVFHREMSGGNLEHREVPQRNKKTPTLFPPANAVWNDPSNEIRYPARVAGASAESIEQKVLNSHLPESTFSTTKQHDSRRWRKMFKRFCET